MLITVIRLIKNKIKRFFYVRRHHYITDPNVEIIHNVKSRTIKINRNLMSFQDNHDIISYVKNIINPRGSEIINNFQKGYMYAGLTKYAYRYNDSNLFKQVKRKLDKFIFDNGKLKYRLIRLDQVPIGLAYIDLFRMSNDKKYLTTVNEIYTFLIDRQKADGRLLYIMGSDVQHVDSLGMTIPFLCEYNEIFPNKNTLHLIRESFNEYNKWGVDKTSGLPVHGYNINSKAKIGSANWGRGIGWYLLGASYYDQFNTSIIDSTLSQITEYTQFIFQPGKFDSSTALMFEIYKQRNVEPPKRSINFIKEHITRSGYVDSCSGDTFTYNRYAHKFTYSEFTNGLFLLLISK